MSETQIPTPPRQEDPITRVLQTAASWAEKNAKGIAAVFAGGIVIGLAWTAVATWNSRQEAKHMETYYLAEKVLNEREKSFAPEVKENPADPTKPITLPAKATKTGDLQKDYGDSLQGLQNLIEQHTSSRAANMAALRLAKVYFEHKAFTEAEPWLNKTRSGSHLTDKLVADKWASAAAESNRCSDAIPVWRDLVKAGELAFVKAELQVKLALCLGETGEKAQAISLLNEVASSGDENQTAQVAKKLARAMEVSQ